MKEFPRISDSEWQVMKVLWKESPAEASEIIAALRPEFDWSPKTIHTLISRLVKKEIVAVKKESPFYLYYPLFSEEECKRVETTSFMRKVYDGSAYSFVSGFIKQEKLSNDEIDELQRILDNMKNEGNEP